MDAKDKGEALCTGGGVRIDDLANGFRRERPDHEESSDDSK